MKSLYIVKKVKVQITVLLLKILHFILSGKIFKVDNLKIEVCKEVFSPFYTFSSELLANAAIVHVKSSDLVLDLGTGSGFLALMVAERACFTIASDISIYAARCALKNLKRNSLWVFCDVVVCDLTSAFRNRAFSIIIFNPPYLEGKPKNNLEKALFGSLDMIRKFFTDARRVLRDTGMILIAYSTLGRIDWLFSEIKRGQWMFAKIKEKRTPWETLTVFKFTKSFKS
ncbi:MAG: hypothetical protein DRJ38_10225 [Thermoprotei archaeon]|nr:MAG: hypothetical protein DRJ38_10225 [Thermoprotei archaeon]